MLTHSNALEREVACLARHRDQTEVGRAATHIANENQIPIAHLLSPLQTVALEPSIESGLRFFEKRHFAEASQFCSLQRKSACGLIKGGRHGDHHMGGIQTGGGE